MKVNEMLVICCLALIVTLTLWNIHQENKIEDLESLALSQSSLLLKVADHVPSFKNTDSLIIANVNRIYKLIDVNWEIRSKPHPIEKDTSKVK